jgi:hypothetical protein
VGFGTSIILNLKIPRQKIKIKIEIKTPELFLETTPKNKSKARAITPNRKTKYKSTKIKERKSTPNKKPKQIV